MGRGTRVEHEASHVRYLGSVPIMGGVGRVKVEPEYRTDWES
jgi:hypothetical protein